MSVGRITQRMLNTSGLASVQTGLTRLGKVQEQLTTGRILNRPSDNPADTTAAMRIRTGLADQGQYARNAADGVGWMTQIDSTLDSVTTALSRARELAAQAISGALGQASLDALAQEVDGLRANTVTLANATYLDRPVFGGVTAGAAAYDDTGAYVGTPGQVTRRIADGVNLRVDVDGRTVFGDGTGSAFDELDALSTALRAGDTAGVQTAAAALKTRVDTVISARTAAGVTYARLQKAEVAAGDAELSLTTTLSSLENTDLAKATMDLQLQEVAYQASLAATARVMQPSLIDFLR
ncbi:hypothetical protein [Nocardioides sp. YIM 152588]|uniref:flagellin N-terminal helical domain-containing protein n=1 Tax=Nocardioides sp. YIM 152588 TaxID=3158259 RepID=UPI0032E4DAB5